MRHQHRHKDYKSYKTIIAGCKKNDRKSQEVLYHKFFPEMERMIRKYTQDQDQLIDIINDGFLKIFLKINSYQGTGSLEGWIRRLIYHSLSDYFRRSKYDARIIVFDEIKKETASKTTDSLFFDDLLQFISLLPEKHEKVFHLHAVEGYKHKEIGNLLSISESTSKWYFSEARKILQKKITASYSKNNYEAI